ncbi:hypothetical protein [Candidatus Protochlamydia phocaeensis]|uniref:bestrophin-like domain n=1 Tax=Candidatus Protochlamydia phocaeensis TaxID=1414722 RepID=UPI000837DB6F|nr:hypothetical protein [Candidatus Protochlamydia phocaeensis]
MLFSLFNIIPLWGVFIFIFLVVLLAFEGGVLLGKRHRLITEKEDRSPIGSIVAASLGLLAFLLAFSFGMGAAKFDERRELVLDEANAIGTTYLRAGYLADPYQTRIRTLLREYVAIRVEALKPEKLEEALKQSDALQDQLWKQAVAIAERNPNSVVAGLFIQSLNDLIDFHSKRVNIGIRLRIPFIIWGTLFFVTILAIGSLGYQFGLTHTRYIGITLLFILTFSSVIALISDLDRPQEGFIKVSQQPLIDLINKFNTSNQQN